MNRADTNLQAQKEKRIKLFRLWNQQNLEKSKEGGLLWTLRLKKFDQFSVTSSEKLQQETRLGPK